MYGVALSVSACLRAGTRVEVAWLVDAGPYEGYGAADALALTPGGGRIGSLLAGALDGQLTELAGSARGRLLRLQVSDIDAEVAGLPGGGDVRCLLAPADTLPGELWELLLAREPVSLVTHLDGDMVVGHELLTRASTAPGDVAAADTITTVLVPVPTLLVVGAGPIADALGVAAAPLGWRTQVTNDPGVASGVIAAMASIDKLVVAAHDLELAGRALTAALSSDVGYIGALGGRRMQEARTDWLAYRGVTDLTRVHGPAGFDIGAETPAEVAISILAEALAATPRPADTRVGK